MIRAEHKEKFIELWNKGLTYKQIATMLPYSANQVWATSRELKEQGILQPRKRGAKSTGNKELVQEQWKLGYKDIDELAQRFNITPRTVGVYLVGLGRQKQYSELSIAIAQELQQREEKRGYMSKIAQQYNVTRQYVSLINKDINKYLGEQI